MKLVYENKLSCENDVKDFVLEGRYILKTVKCV